jgi:hypothetical protein
MGEMVQKRPETLPSESERQFWPSGNFGELKNFGRTATAHKFRTYLKTGFKNEFSINSPRSCTVNNNSKVGIVEFQRLRFEIVSDNCLIENYALFSRSKKNAQ